jgi:hypothetical protein
MEAIFLLPFPLFPINRTFLPAWFAIISAGASFTAVAVATTAATTTTAVTTTATVTATAATVIPTAATRTTVRAGTSFIHRQVTTLEILAVELLNRCRRFFRRGHLDKAEAS